MMSQAIAVAPLLGVEMIQDGSQRSSYLKHTRSRNAAVGHTDHRLGIGSVEFQCKSADCHTFHKCIESVYARVAGKPFYCLVVSAAIHRNSGGSKKHRRRINCNSRFGLGQSLCARISLAARVGGTLCMHQLAISCPRRARPTPPEPH